MGQISRRKDEAQTETRTVDLSDAEDALETAKLTSKRLPPFFSRTMDTFVSLQGRKTSAVLRFSASDINALDLSTGLLSCTHCAVISL